jgi:hypothetical protein
MCDDCEDAEPIFVAYYRKAGGNLWRPPQMVPTLKPPGFACDEGRAEPDGRARPEGKIL